MPRPQRINLEGALTYVTCRGEPGLSLFRDGRDLETYLDLLSQYRSEHGFKLFAYSLSLKEVHLCLEAGAGATISRIMHDLNSRYTKLYGSRWQHSGHLFQGRFRSVVLEKEPYLLRLVHFIHAQPAPLSSSLALYREGAAADSTCLDSQELLARLAGQPLEAELLGENEEMRRILQRPVVGSLEFVEAARKCASAVPTGSGGPLFEEEEEEEEEELVPVRIRKGFRHNGWIGLALIAVLAGLSMRTAPSNGPVQVIVQPAVLAPQTQMVQPVSLTAGGPQTAVLSMDAPLQGTVWQIQLRPMDNLSGSSHLDRLRFDRNQVTSSRLSSQGFAGSNYTLTPQAGGTFIWETMQTGTNGEIVCWRGECDGQRMRGVMTRQKSGEEVESFNFIAVNPMSET